MELVYNTDKTGLNGSQKSLYLKNTTDGDWWGGVSLELPAKVLINADSKIHMMLKGEMASIELTYFFDDNSEVWGGKFEGVSDEWVDRVNDLGGQEGKMLRRIRVATFPKGWDNASINPDKELYIDEIIINTDPNPRTLSRGDNKDYSLSGTWTSNSLTSMLDNANSINLMNGNILNNGKIIPSNPNCLVYANFAAADNNCIINNEGDLTLTDGYSFHCPLEFTANNVTYTRQAWQDGNHETICIPFPLSEGWEDLKTLSSSTTSTVTFADAKDGIIANKPYIIKWPEATENKDQKQTLILKAGNVTIPVTDGLTDMMGDNAASFIGTYADKREEGIYILQSTNSFKMITAASDAEVKVTPFHAYLAGQFNNSPNNIKVLFDDGGTTDLSKETLADKMLIGSGKGFITVQSACPQNVVIYTIDGKQVFNARIDEGATTISNLVQGLYILNNQKVSVK